MYIVYLGKQAQSEHGTGAEKDDQHGGGHRRAASMLAASAGRRAIAGLRGRAHVARHSQDKMVAAARASRTHSHDGRSSFRKLDDWRWRRKDELASERSERQHYQLCAQDERVELYSIDLKVSRTFYVNKFKTAAAAAASGAGENSGESSCTRPSCSDS